ncbi:OTU-like cysteine protease domain-containing protein [Spironucleus salmonicida]|nr:OTU-like cysteine protease domain-containing protein [Spironucleus salmonicida]
MKPNEIKLFHKKEQLLLCNYLKQSKLDQKSSKQLQKELKQVHDADLEQKDEEEDYLAQIKQLNKQNTDTKLLEQLEKSKQQNSIQQHYLKNEKLDRKQIEQNKIREILNNRNKQQQVVPGDGDCLFSAIEFGSQTVNLRRKMLDFVNENDETRQLVQDLTGDVSGWAKRLEKDWGDELEIAILSKMLGAKISVYKVGGVIEYGQENLIEIEICYLRYGVGGFGHYNAIVNK